MPKFFSYDFSTKIIIVQSCLSPVTNEGDTTPHNGRWLECLKSSHPCEKCRCLEWGLGWILILLIDNFLATLLTPYGYENLLQQEERIIRLDLTPRHNRIDPTTMICWLEVVQFFFFQTVAVIFITISLIYRPFYVLMNGSTFELIPQQYKTQNLGMVPSMVRRKKWLYILWLIGKISRVQLNQGIFVYSVSLYKSLPCWVCIFCLIIVVTSPTLTPAKILAMLDLEPHVEGGYFRETFRAKQSISTVISRRLCTIFMGEARLLTTPFPQKVTGKQCVSALI